MVNQGVRGSSIRMIFESMDVNRCLVKSTSNLSRYQCIKRRQKKGSSKRHVTCHNVEEKEFDLQGFFFPVPINFGHPNMAQCVMQTDVQIQLADMQAHSYRSGGCKELTTNTDGDRLQCGLGQDWELFRPDSQRPSETAEQKCQNSNVSRVLNQCFQLDIVILSFMVTAKAPKLDPGFKIYILLVWRY